MSTLKMTRDWVKPSIRVWSSGPQPMPSRWSSVAGVVMLFHSLKSRMNRTLPVAVDGENVPKVAYCRAYQGATTRTNSATAPRAAASGTRGPGAPPARAVRHARHRFPRNTRPIAPSTSSPSFRARDASPARSPAIANDQAWPLSPRPARNSAAATSVPYSAKFSGWTMYASDSAGIAVMIPAPTATSRRSPASRAMPQASGAAAAPISANGRFAASVVGPRAHMNGTITIDGERHPVRVRRDRQDRVGREPAADLGEDPHEVDGEAVARRELPGDVDVVGGVGVGGVGEPGPDDEAHHQGEQEQQQRGAHSAVHGSTGLPFA